MCVTLASGCVLLPGAQRPAPPFPDAPALAPDGARLLPAGHLLLHGAIHCHTRWSHDASGRAFEIARAAARVGLDFVCTTDHWRPGVARAGARGRVGDVIVLHGVELRASGGSVLGIDVNLPLAARARPKTAADPFERVRRAGALALIGHAEGFRAWPEGLRLASGLEVANLHAMALARPRLAVFAAALTLPPNAFLRWLVRARSPAVLAHWDRIGRARRLPGWGGADAHANIRLFGERGGVVISYAQAFRAVSNYVIARGRSADAIREALAEGRGWVAFESLGCAGAFRFALTDAHGRLLACPGAATPWRPGLYLEAICPGGAELRVLRDGRPLAHARGRIRLPVRSPGVYRVEAWLGRDPFVFANPLYVRPAASHPSLNRSASRTAPPGARRPRRSEPAPIAPTRRARAARTCPAPPLHPRPTFCRSPAPPA